MKRNLRRTFRPSPAAVAVLACALAQGTPAQYAFVPNGANSTEGNAADREPFGLDGVRHLTYIHQDQLGAIPRQASINNIAYRRDAPMPVAVMRRPQAIWQVRMGAYTGSVAQPPSAWPRSTDPNWALVFQPRQISFPDLSQPSGGGPAPFQLTFWLDQPFVYTGTHLGIEHFVADGQATHDYFVDAVDTLVPGGSVDTLPGGLGCPAGQNRAAGQAPNPGGGSAEFYLFGALPDANVVLGIGISDRTWGGFSLPLDLGALGLNGCRVMVSMDSFVPVRTTSAGVGEARAEIPAVRAFLGATFYSQWACPSDTRVSQNIPLTLSDGLKYTLGTNLNAGFLGMSVVSAYSGSNQFGYVQPNRGPVVRIGW